MKIKLCRTWAAAVATVGLMLPPTALSATQNASSCDIALRPGGLLVGQVVDRQGLAKAGTPVSIVFDDKEVAHTTTDENGVFAARGLHGGPHQLNTVEGASACHLWAATAAPPTAQPAALIVSGRDAVRGQADGGRLQAVRNWIKAHPYITAGTVVTVIAVPLVLADDGQDGN